MKSVITFVLIPEMSCPYMYIEYLTKSVYIVLSVLPASRVSNKIQLIARQDSEDDPLW